MSRNVKLIIIVFILLTIYSGYFLYEQKLVYSEYIFSRNLNIDLDNGKLSEEIINLRTWIWKAGLMFGVMVCLDLFLGVYISVKYFQTIKDKRRAKKNIQFEDYPKEKQNEILNTITCKHCGSKKTKIFVEEVNNHGVKMIVAKCNECNNTLKIRKKDIH